MGLTVADGALDTDSGGLVNLQLNVLASFAKLERGMLIERLRGARAARRARDERSAGRIPLGYTPHRKTKQLVVAAKEAAVVRWFFARAEEGACPALLAHEANAHRHPSKTGRIGTWNARTVLRLLRNLWDLFTRTSRRRAPGTPEREHA